MSCDPDAQRFRDYAEGFSSDSPVDLSGREGYDAHDAGTCRHDLDDDCPALGVENSLQGATDARDEAIADDVDAVLEHLAMAAPVPDDPRGRSILDLLREIEQQVQRVYHAADRNERRELLVKLKELLNAAIIKERSQ